MSKSNLLKMKYNTYLIILGVFTYSIFMLSCSILPNIVPKKISIPVTISTKKQYLTLISKDSNEQIVNILSKIPNIQLDLRYATTNNFMKKAMYPIATNTTFLKLPAANALLKIQKELNKNKLGLKIFDAYRPYFVTKQFWKLVHDERYVANPIKGSDHNRGTAIDVTLINLTTHEELNMGTGFDNFTDSAHHNFTAFSTTVLNNRLLLKNIMEKYGFKKLNTEWWHYSFEDSEQHAILNVRFTTLNQLTQYY